MNPKPTIHSQYKAALAMLRQVDFPYVPPHL